MTAFRNSMEWRLGLRYAAIVVVCFALLGGLAYHEFIEEKRQREALGIPAMPDDIYGDEAEVFFYGMIPVVLGFGWWFMRRSLAPINDLARGVQRIHAGNLQEPLPRSGSGDEVDRLTAVFNDLTARLDASFQQIREFTLHASHELKTPLTVMRAQLETELHEAPEKTEWIESHLDEVVRLSQIVDSLTLLRKADAGLVALQHQPVQIGELVREAFEDAILLAQPHGVAVTLGDCEDLTVSCDRPRLRQLLLILTDNAVKYNRPGGTLAISLRGAAGSAQLEVTNTGEGIPPQTLSRVFGRFQRGENATSVEGCGLGLAIAQWIVQAHGGRIEIQSTPGETTTARVLLPLASCASADERNRAALPVLWRAFGRA